MVTKQKPVAEVDPAPEPEPEGNEPVTKSDVVEIVKDALKDILPGTPDAPIDEPVADEKPLTSRQEEQRTHNIVTEAIKAFKEEFVGDDKKDDTKVDESKPGSKPVRWIEKHLWGAE